MVTLRAAFFVSQRWADWYSDVPRRGPAERGGDPRAFDDVDPVMRERRRLAPPPPTVADVADHVDHVREVAGLDHIGIGGDYDGASNFPAGMEDVSGYPLLLEELRGRGYVRGRAGGDRVGQRAPRDAGHGVGGP